MSKLKAYLPIFKKGPPTVYCSFVYVIIEERVLYVPVTDTNKNPIAWCDVKLSSFNHTSQTAERTRNLLSCDSYQGLLPVTTDLETGEVTDAS